MLSNNGKVIVFKSDRIGDLINISSCLKIIKNNILNSHITLVCSKYNYQVAKNYKFIDKYIILDDKNILMTILFNFKFFFLTKYKYLFQFDGRVISYRISYFVRASIKSTICFEKRKKVYNLTYNTSRPPKPLLYLFFDNYVFRNENYSNTANAKSIVLYQNLYFTILSNLKFVINSRRNIFPLDTDFKETFKSCYNTIIKKKYYLFHIDERWNLFDNKIYKDVLFFLKKISKNNKIVITTGIKSFIFLDVLEKTYNTYNFENNKFVTIKPNKGYGETVILKNMPLNLLAYFIKYSVKNFSAHSGPIITIGAAFDKETIDVIKKNKNNELDRWIPVVSNYKRINFENLNENYLKNLTDLV